METQLASTIWLPAFYPPALTYHHDVSSVGKPQQQLLHPVLSGQPHQPQMIVSPTGAAGHVMLHPAAAPQQILPVLPQEAQAHLLPSGGDYLSTNLLLRHLHYVAPHHAATPSPAPPAPTTTLFDPNCQHGLTTLQHISQITMQSKLAGDPASVAFALHKTQQQQRRKKVSPSAKRRSRLRLIAFLEAKKEKCRMTSTGGDLDKSDSRISESFTESGEVSPKSFAPSDTSICGDETLTSRVQATPSPDCGDPFALPFSATQRLVAGL